jgi:hypothetical protein
MPASMHITKCQAQAITLTNVFCWCDRAGLKHCEEYITQTYRKARATEQLYRCWLQFTPLPTSTPQRCYVLACLQAPICCQQLLC